MRHDAAFVIIFMAAICVCSLCHAEGESERRGDVIIPDGMETVKKGDVNVILPKNGQIRKQGSVLLIETGDEYASRKFIDTEERFKKIEKDIEDQKKELADLKETVRALKK